MTSGDSIAEAIAKLRHDFGLGLDQSRRGPVLLNQFFEACNLRHVAVADLSYLAVAEHLLIERYVSHPDRLGDFPNTTEPLDGLLFWSGEDGLAFVNANDILSRRRFTAAHELGHAVLHRDRMGRFRADVQIVDGTEEGIEEIEREANRFAAELLMPAEVIQMRADDLTREHGACPHGVLEYRLAAELLVSQQAIRFRLKSLNIGQTE